MQASFPPCARAHARGWVGEWVGWVGVGVLEEKWGSCEDCEIVGVPAYALVVVQFGKRRNVSKLCIRINLVEVAALWGHSRPPPNSCMGLEFMCENV